MSMHNAEESYLDEPNDWPTEKPDREDTRPDHPSDYGAYCRPWPDFKKGKDEP